jgi:hypothetical protein
MARGARVFLVLTPEDAERVGVALIQAATLPVGDPTQPSEN